MNEPWFVTEEFQVAVGERRLNVVLASAKSGNIHENPILLLTFGTHRHSVFTTFPTHFASIRPFLEEGHRVLSFDIPNHGERVNEHGSDIPGLRDAFLHGEDPFHLFIEDAEAVITFCLENGLVREGRIAVSGSSRSGYLALRLIAHDPRIQAGAVFSPVTDWRELREFSEVQNLPEIEKLRLSRYLDGFIGKYLFLIIPYHDIRVNTASCCRFYLDVLQANDRAGYPSTLLDLCITPEKGHACGETWLEFAGRSLLDATDGHYWNSDSPWKDNFRALSEGGNE